MGPLLLNGIVDQGWSLVIMFALGLAFGMILEQAGFSTSRKLVGIFFGYDFVVLKVFFTAGITAMIGLIFMEYFGLIDMSLVSINSNHLWSAVIGGVIMGFGFILGGYCPGTSITAAMIGKIDSWLFIAGIFIGIFVFGSFYDFFHRFFSGHYFDGELLYNTLSISRALFVFLMILMAIAAFAVGHYFENNATIGVRPTNEVYKSYVLEAIILIVLGLVIFGIPEKSAKSFTERSEKKILSRIMEQDRMMSADEFAYRVINDNRSMEIIDVRPDKEFSIMSFPNSMNIPLSEITRDNFKEFLDQDNKKVVFVSNGGIEASKAWIYAFRKGYDHIYILDGGINKFISDIYMPPALDSNEYRFREIFKYRFRKRAATFLKEGSMETVPADGKKEKPKKMDVKAPVKSGGGC